ncbi:hypothetical protein [Amycolatopsis azurea]|uniref:HK97 gp10 family phage protein n=1 Tax=Amycolatopsis azurea DSM 43854 TaxID=1238180 RepID=M2PTT6_9PSEU|nr:hypothetical protein [Amycolatopsis azurea]EMD22920.1 hypothetical protein C791_7920 [Amycolatopsis azurea DSM 43854]OOC04283.1 hypothetical protein B0293_23800 [Amycolatopsis azurea DSM 43854]
MPVDLDLSGPEKRLRDIARALRTEEDGKQLRKELARNLRTALQPARQQARAAIRSMPAQTKHPGRSLRSAIASKIQVVAKMSGKTAGARAVTKTIKLRGFTHAPRRTNSAAGWSHPNWNHGSTSHQVGKPDWFDDAMRGAAMDARRRVVDAMDATARRLSRKV